MNDALNMPKGGDDAVVAGLTIREATAAEEEAERDQAAELANDDPESRTQFQRLFEATEHLTFFVSGGEAYMSPGDSLAIPLESRRSEQHIRLAYFEKFHKPPSSESLKQFVDIRTAQLSIRGEHKPVFRRVGRVGDRYFLDLSRDGKVIEMTADGWRVLESPRDVFFIRRNAEEDALPIPEPGGNVLALSAVVNLPQRPLRLLLSFLVAALRPGFPFIVIVLEGEAGSGKTTLARILKYMIDPSKVLLRSMPATEDAFAVFAANSHLLALDNLDRITPDQSDRLCRVSTGGGIGKRKLYTDGEEFALDIKRPVIMTGIEGLVDRADMADRVALVQLERVPSEDRMTEEVLWNLVEEIRPQVLGGLLDAFCAGLKNLDRVNLDNLPRMADFARFATAAEAGLPWQQGEALDAYEESRGNLFEQALEKDRVALAVVKLMEREKSFGRREWTGTAAELLDVLDPPFGVEDRWPRKPSTLGIRITKALPLLRERGIAVDKIKSGSVRKLRLYFLSEKNPSHPSHLSHSSMNTGPAVGQVANSTCPTRPTDLSLLDDLREALSETEAE